MISTDPAEYRRSNDYREFLDDLLDGTRAAVEKAQLALDEAERGRRVGAAIAVRAGYGKTAVANRLGVSRPTLDAWLRISQNSADEIESVQSHERFVDRQVAEGNG